MAQTWRCWFWNLGQVSFLVIGYAFASSGDCVLAQVTPDATLGAESSVVTPTAPGSPVDVIEGGATRGSNLFHSFEQFSVPTGGEAFFNNALDIQNIISRVTGGSISNIDGLIRANGTANLFLLNPNGIAFGSNARLSIGGSFVGSTASSLNFADGTFFSATATTTTPLLTVSVPLGLQFGPQAGEIRMQGPGSVREPETFLLLNREAGLSVQPSETLALVGSGVALEGGILTTDGGRIELGSVASPSVVSLTPIDFGWALGYEGVPTYPSGSPSGYGDIQLSGAAAVDASSEGGGNIQVRGRQVTLKDGSQIEASTLGSLPGGTLAIVASESIEVIGKTTDSLFFSGLFTQVYPEATGNGGKLSLETSRLIVRDGAGISASTYGLGAGGTLEVRASESVEVIGRSADGQSGSALLTQANRGATGSGGKLTVETGRLIVRDGAGISARNLGAGSGGILEVRASESVEVIGRSADDRFPSVLTTSSGLRTTGSGGKLTVETGRLIVRDGAQIQAGTLGAGSGGTLEVRASDSVEVIGTSADGQFASGLFTATEGEGNAGNLTIATGRLLVRDGAQVASGTFGIGAGGTLSVTAKDAVEVIGRSANGRVGSRLSAQTQGESDAGDLTIATGRLTVRDGAQVSAGTFGTGDGGTLSVTASDVVEVIGRSADSRQVSSGLFTQADGDGNAGNLTIATGRLLVRDGARVTVRSLGSGNAGSLQVAASSVLLENQGNLLASTASGEGGNIYLEAQDLLARGGSAITATAGGTGNGGNITIDTDTLVALENSDITANAEQSFGGRVSIIAQGIFGTQFQDAPTLESDITATGGSPELSGIVEINTPDVDPSQGLVTLPTELVDVSNQIASGCPASVRRDESQFIITGRGGLPPNPRQVLRSNAVQVDWVELDASRDNRSSTKPATNPTKEKAPTQIVEANGWTINDKGDVVLTATAPSATLDIPWVPKSGCNARETSS